MTGAVADPQQDTLSSKPPETGPKGVNKTWGLMNDGRETNETEQSLQDVPKVFSEWKDIQQPFNPQGSLSFKDSKLMEVSDITSQVEDKTVTQEENTLFNPDLFRDMFKKPLEGVSNIAAGVVGEIPSAGLDLLKEITSLAPEAEPKDPEEAKNENDNLWVRQKQENLEVQIENVPIQKQQSNAKDINRISGGQMTKEEVIQEVLQGVTFNIEDPMSASKVAYTGIGEAMVAWKKRDNQMKATQRAEQAQEEAEVQKPKNLLTNLNAQEGNSMVANQIMGAG